MLGYFRINDPYRLVIIFFLLLLFRLPYLISPDWLSIPELKWMLVGEKLNDGALLYADVLDDIGPLSALVYKGIDFLFGRSHLTIQIVGLIVFYFQIFYINFLALKHKMYNENNYLPALFYGILGLTTFNIMTLSPVLLGMTFILFSLNNLLNHVETRQKTDSNLVNIGLFTGIAILFYLPFIWVLVVHIMILLFFTNTIKRRYLLMIYGLLVPVLIVWLFYVWNDESSAFYNYYLGSISKLNPGSLLEAKTILILYGFTIVLYLISSFSILSGLGFNIFQVRIQKTMFFASIVMLGIWFFYTEKSGEEMVMFLPWIAFFLSHFFLTIRNRLKRELSFLAYVLSILVFYIGFTFHIFNADSHISFSSELINTSKEIQEPPYQGSGILVLGSDIQPYYYGKLATPYFNWELSKDELHNLNYYDNIEEINRKIRSDMPEYIIDQEALAPKIFDKIPLLGEEFRLIENGLYKRMPKNN